MACCHKRGRHQIKIHYFNHLLSKIIFASLMWHSSLLYADELKDQRHLCEVTLEAISSGSAVEAEASDVSASDRPPTSEQQKSSTEVIQGSIEQIRRIGGGLPVNRSTTYDANLADDRGWMIIQQWNFPNGVKGFAGCARYKASSQRWNTLFRMEASESVLRKYIEDYVKKR